MNVVRSISNLIIHQAQINHNVKMIKKDKSVTSDTLPH